MGINPSPQAPASDETYAIESTTSPSDYFSTTFFRETWPVLIGETKAIDLSATTTPDKRTKVLWENIKSSLDDYIDMTKIPTDKASEETDVAFFTRVTATMYEMNQKVASTWEDCWPSTAKNIRRLNCALGSLVAARALERAGYPEAVIEYGYPGPMSHAVIFARGYYIDQANGVVLPVVGQTTVDGIKAYRIEIDPTDKETLYKVPFRLIPSCHVDQGVPPLIWNLGPMLRRAMNAEKPDLVAKRLVADFKLDPDIPYGSWARKNLLPEEWQPARMDDCPEWINERRESSERINS